MTERSESGTSQWKQRLAECGVVLDWMPDLAQHVVSGDVVRHRIDGATVFSAGEELAGIQQMLCPCKPPP